MSAMTVTIEYLPKRPVAGGGEAEPKWVVSQTEGTAFGVSDVQQGSYDTKSSAKSAARRVASDGERIIADTKNGGQEVVREGSR